MIFGISVQRIIRQSVFSQHSGFRRISPLCTSTAIRQTANKEYSKMTYQIEERGSPNTIDYKLYISKSTLKLYCKAKCLYKSRICHRYLMWVIVCLNSCLTHLYVFDFNVQTFKVIFLCWPLSPSKYLFIIFFSKYFYFFITTWSWIVYPCKRSRVHNIIKYILYY